jgi:hypothetical protein
MAILLALGYLEIDNLSKSVAVAAIADWPWLPSSALLYRGASWHPRFQNHEVVLTESPTPVTIAPSFNFLSARSVIIFPISSLGLIEIP